MDAPKIVPVQGQVMGAKIAIVADSDPELFPNGLEIAIMVPGKLAPIGGGAIPIGCMLAILGPELSKMYRPEMRKVLQQNPGPGEVRAPGVH